MSTLVVLDGVAHWVSHTHRSGPLDDSLLIAVTYCHLVRHCATSCTGVPTCLVCVGKHDQFRHTERELQYAGGDALATFHRMVYGPDGKAVP